MSRKTHSVKTLIEKANMMLAAEFTQEEKNGISFLLSEILHETGNYAGFSYLESAGVTNSGKPDVRVEREYDRKYHVSHKLDK